MRTNNIRIKMTGLKLLASFFIFSNVLMSCEDDEHDSETPYFNIEGAPTGLSVSASAKEQSYVVRSNRFWQIMEQAEADWIRALPAEGEDDGIFTFDIKANDTFEPRTVNYAFIIDGVRQTVFPVEQAASVPEITVQNGETSFTIPANGGEVSIPVTANIEWAYSLDQVDWLSEVSVSADQIVLNAAENNNAARSAYLTVTAVDYPNLSQTITLTQSPGSVLLDENFSWLTYGSAVFYTTSGETRYDAWTSEEKNMGWVSTVNTTDGSGNTPMVYARQGFVKLGKTGYGGDLIVPKLNFEGSRNLKVTFKAVPYMTAKGTKDDNTLNIILTGPGTLSRDIFTIDNWPDYDTDPDCITIWTDPVTERNLTITGATAETQIKFLAGDYYLKDIGAGKNRIFLDDIKIEIVE